MHAMWPSPRRKNYPAANQATEAVVIYELKEADTKQAEEK